jgi:predicted DNA-binding mobile mystery protein A
MKREYRNLRLKQLSTSLEAFQSARRIRRPVHGWLRAVREALGITQQQVANETQVKRQVIQKFEFAEASDRITLRNLRRVADALGCELVYAIVPKSGTIQELAEREIRNKATKRVLSVQHSMALEDQAPSGVKELIEEETKRASRKS